MQIWSQECVDELFAIVPTLQPTISAEHIFLQHQARAEGVVNHYCYKVNPHVAYLRDDILSEALIGLWSACLRYDSKRNDNFWGFAKVRVHGAILDYLRRERIQIRSDRPNQRQIEMISIEVLEISI